MQFRNTFIRLALFTSAVFAAPSALKSVVKYNGDVKSGSYIITLKTEVSASSHIQSLNLSIDSTITNRYSHVLNGFAGEFTEDDLNALRAHGDVERIEENGIATVVATQTTAPWGLGRISSPTKLTDQTDTHLTFSYEYDDSAGTGSDVYIIDTGIYVEHPAFEGRASWGANFVVGEGETDGYGHGTHCAGTAVSGPYGVAKGAHVIAVKVLSSSGSGAWADVISGIDWVATIAPTTGRPSVASLSLGGGGIASVDAAVAGLVAVGVPVAVAAGNNNADAGNYSPSREPTAITVGASTIADARAYFSNYGAVVDVWAPGLDVTSTWNNGGTNTISGTSMATPHVAGLIAYYLGLGVPASGILAKLQSTGISGALTSIPAGTVNLLVNNGL